MPPKQSDIDPAAEATPILPSATMSQRDEDRYQTRLAAEGKILKLKKSDLEAFPRVMKDSFPTFTLLREKLQTYKGDRHQIKVAMEMFGTLYYSKYQGIKKALKSEEGVDFHRRITEVRSRHDCLYSKFRVLTLVWFFFLLRF